MPAFFALFTTQRIWPGSMPIATTASTPWSSRLLPQVTHLSGRPRRRRRSSSSRRAWPPPSGSPRPGRPTRCRRRSGGCRWSWPAAPPARRAPRRPRRRPWRRRSPPRRTCRSSRASTPESSSSPPQPAIRPTERAAIDGPDHHSLEHVTTMCREIKQTLRLNGVDLSGARPGEAGAPVCRRARPGPEARMSARKRRSSALSSTASRRRTSRGAGRGSPRPPSRAARAERSTPTPRLRKVSDAK